MIVMIIYSMGDDKQLKFKYKTVILYASGPKWEYHEHKQIAISRTWLGKKHVFEVPGVQE